MSKLDTIIALRFLKARKRNRLLSFLSITSVIGIMLGTATLIVVVSVMDGFTENLKAKFLGSNPHIILTHDYSSKIYNWESYIDLVEKQPHVVSAAPLIIGHSMASSGNKITGAAVRGVDLSLDSTFKEISKTVVRGDLKKLKDSFDTKTPGILLGQELMFNLGLIIGKEVTLISPTVTRGAFGIIPKMRKYKVVGFFDTGIYEHNKTLAYIDLKEAQDFFGTGKAVNAITVITDNADKSGDIAIKIQNVLNSQLVGDDDKFWARDWMSMNQSLFHALKLEQYAMFIILTLIIVVASFNIVSMITVTVKDKRKEIAILRAMGASEKVIKWVFIKQGLFIGAVGTFLGDLLGYGICFVLKNFQIFKIPKEIYHTGTIPVVYSPQILIIVTICSMLITYLASVVPSGMSARMNPLEAIRND